MQAKTSASSRLKSGPAIATMILSRAEIFGSLRAIDVGLAFDDVHRRELRQRDESAERNRAERILHAVDRFLPERFAEPDAELLDVQSAPARRQKMAQLMHDDEQIKEDDDLKEDEEDAKDVRHDKLQSGTDETSISTSFYPDSIRSNHGGRFGARPLIGPQYCIERRDAQRRYGDS